MYLTYDEYKAFGGELSETAFNRNIDRAIGIIDNATYGRIEFMKTVPKQVQVLCRDLVEYLANNPSTEKAISSKSQSSGPVSESEAYTVKTKDEQMKEINGIIRDYLLSVEDDNGTPLLYRGCSF